jgi:hypothetical protein
MQRRLLPETEHEKKRKQFTASTRKRHDRLASQVIPNHDSLLPPARVLESQKLPEPGPVFTPLTKVEQGAHGETISPEKGQGCLSL